MKNDNIGRCLTKSHNIYGNMYLNLNKNNEFYIRTKNKNAINKYSIPFEINNKNLKLCEAIKIIEDYNKPVIKNVVTTIESTNKKGVILGKIDDENVFLNHSMFNDKYYLKTSKSKENIPIPNDCIIETLNIEKAKEIINFHKLYNNKLIGVRGNHEIKLKNGCYSLYIEYNNKLFSIPKYVLDSIDNLDLVACNKIIDYHCRIKTPDAKPTNSNELEPEITIPTKASFLDIVKKIQN